MRRTTGHISRLAFRFGWLVFAAVLFSVETLAYTPTISSNGKAVRWPSKAKINLAGNPANQSGLPGGYFFDAVVRGLQRWKAASGGLIRFDYWQGTDDAVYEPSSRYNGLSSIYFISQDNTGFEMDPSVIGLTQVWYDVETGRILEIDIAFNDVDYVFTSNPADTSGSGSGVGPGPVGSRVFLEGVLTHEIGHAVGLSHGGALQSTMLFLESPEQSKLSCDDILGVRSIYRNAGADGAGSVRGRVLSPEGAPVAGAHVVAISRDRGVALGTALTDAEGRFKVRPLEPGSYHLLIEPFYAGSTSLPGYYSFINANVCPNGAFSRTFVQEEGGFTMRVFGVVASAESNAGDLRVACNGPRNANVPGPVGGYSISDARAVFSSPDSAAFSVVDRMNQSGWAQYYRLEDVEGDVDIRALSYSLYSPVRVFVSLHDATGNPLDAGVTHPVYEGSSGFRNFDSRVVAKGLSRGDYILRVQPGHIASQWYPAASVSMDFAPFVLLTGRIDGKSPPFVSHLPDNARCAISENFPSYKSPPGDPVRSDEGGGPFGFCGTVADRAERRSGLSESTLTGPSAFAVLGWWLPWVFMGAGAYFNKLTIRRSGRRGRSLACVPASPSNTLEE